MAELSKFEAKYSLGSEISSGGYGTVWKGVNKNTKEQVAIKIIAKDNYAKSDLPRLAVEIALCKKLAHKHLIKCHDVYNIEVKNEVRVVMEYAKGEELFSLIQSQGKIEENVTKLLIYQLLLALQYLHSQNIIFRDVKPENIILKEPFAKGNHHVLLCDFGLAVVKGQEKARGAFGSVYYIAPEALTPDEYTEKVDIWATGIVAHACVVGFPPFCTENNVNEEIIKLIQTTELDLSVKELQSCSVEFKSFLEKTVTKNVDSRLTASECLSHDWIKSLTQSKSKTNATKPTFHNYKNYVNKR